MGVSMDTFMQALLVERSSALDNSDNTNASSSSTTRECVVVVDNARYHAERWSKLPRRLRTSLLSNKKDPTRRRLSPKKNKVTVTRTNSNSSNRSEDRWNPKQERSEGKAAMPAPPACPQRQQSIEVTAEALAHVTMMDHSAPNNASHTHTPGLCSEGNCMVQIKAPKCPQRRLSVQLEDNSPNSVVSHQRRLGELPRMPERQASDDSECNFLPPPPMTTSTDFITTSNTTSSNNDEKQAPLLGYFSGSVKRSSASLLDDDDDSDDDEDCFMGGSARLPNKPQLWNTLSH